MTERRPNGVLAGQTVIGGFDGRTAGPELLARLRRGHLGGAILFARNVGTPEEVADLTGALAAAAPADLPIVVSVDQEGGRVARLGPPVLRLPPMRVLGEIDDVNLTRRAAHALGEDLVALGFSLDFAPVLDVDTNPRSPVIGDRSFGADPTAVARHGIAFLEGLAAAGVLACGKHFPGHGDTEQDSHRDLPRVRHDADRLRGTEILPFRAACEAGIPCIMTAHVVYDALEPDVPATLSRAILGDLLRDELGFGGLVVSDDLEMGAIRGRMGIGEAAVEAVRAGCDLLLVCKSPAAQEEAREAVERAATDAPEFRGILVRAVERGLGVRRALPAPPTPDPDRVRRVLSAEAHRAIEDEIDRRRLG